MKVSFDFDDTLDRETVQKYAAELIERGFEVWIVTSRYDTETYIKIHHTEYHYGELANKDLFDVAKKLGIPEERIKFLGYAEKCNWFKKNKDFIFHLDDDWILVRKINEQCVPVRGISYFHNPN